MVQLPNWETVWLKLQTPITQVKQLSDSETIRDTLCAYILGTFARLCFVTELDHVHLLAVAILTLLLNYSGMKLRRWFRNSMDTTRIPCWSPWPSWYLGSEPWDLILINHSANYWRLLQLVKLSSFAISVLMARRIYAGLVSRSDHGISYYSLDRTKQHNLWRPKQAERPVTQNPKADMKDAEHTSGCWEYRRRPTCHLHGLNANGSSYMSGFKCTAGGHTMIPHPAGIV